MNNQQKYDPELELLTNVAAGNEKAFKQLYDQIHESLFFFIYRRVKDRETAEDVHIEVFTEVWRSADKFKGNSKVKTWIFGIARNMSMNALRKQKKHLNIDDLEQPTRAEAIDTRQITRKEVMKEALLKISVKHKEILDLVFFHEMNYQEISQVLSISVNTVKTRVFYAKQALRKTFIKMGIKSNGLYT